MLDYCGEEEFYPMDGDNDNYYEYANPDEFRLPAIPKRVKEPFVCNPSYYDDYVLFDRIIERDNNCYSVLKNNIWMNIPKKIVRCVEGTKILLYMPIFRKIYDKSSAKQK
jgi:hypothetical protein